MVCRFAVAAAVVALVGCGASGDPASPDALAADGATTADATPDAPSLFGMTGGMCGVLQQMDLTGESPQFFRASLTFEREFVDPDDRPLLTPGGLRIRETPNAGGSSVFSEVFAFEELARCEGAELLKTEEEIAYDTVGKKTDLLVRFGDVKIGVSVVRTFGYPLGTPYTLDQAKTLIQRKLDDINTSSMLVSEADRWEKQFLSVLAWDDATVETVHEAWTTFSAETRADTQLVVVATHGTDLFIYNE